MANTSINLVGLDFASLKDNLKTYLKTNTQFKDLDYEGSNINVLLDLLAYNTYLNSFYTNMVASEMFLDTATLRDSVVSHAKSLNYTPRSYVSSYADVVINITPTTTVTNVYVPKNTTFTARVGSNTYTFSTNDSNVLTQSNNGVFSLSTSIYEGVNLTESFTVDNSNTVQRFVLSNPSVDISSVSITVLEDNGDVTLDYVRATSLVNLTATTQGFFVVAAENEQYEIQFGDNTFGRSPKDGAIIVVKYRAASGELPNGAGVFVSDGSIDGHTNVAITTVANARYGQINESLESIRTNAIRNYQVRGRAVTTSDYEVLLKTQFPEIESISAYGGENIEPPQFGKVYIAVDIQNADGTPQNRLDTYKQYITDKTPVSIDVVFIQPEFMYAQIIADVKYNTNLTTKLSSDIKTLVQAKISEHNTTYLNGFKKTLYYSKMVSDITSADTSIVSNDTTIKAIKVINPTLSAAQSFTVNYGFPLETETGVRLSVPEYHYGHTVQSSAFLYNGNRCILTDDTQGTLYIAKVVADTVEIVVAVGTVNYTIGQILINNLNVSSYEGSGIKIYVRPDTKDFASTKNVLLSIKDSDVTVNITPVKV